ncbi:MAG: hypothetical protein JKY81_01745 [Colwellia sp.]|nr:hypothetical protein [Colwellia sp.]
MTVEQDAIDAAYLSVEQSIGRGEYIDITQVVDVSLVSLFHHNKDKDDIEDVIEGEM